MPQLVRVGDYAKGTIYSISRETGYKVADIIASNPEINIHNLTADTIIKLPTPKEVFTAVNIDDYGSIYSISRETGVSVDDIIAANPEINVNSIPSGASIKLPTSSAVMQNVNIDDYGTIYQIHKHTGVPVEDIVKANPDIDINHIPPHTNIKVPSKSIPSKQTPKVTNPKPPTPKQEEFEDKVESKSDKEIGNEPQKNCKCKNNVKIQEKLLTPSKYTRTQRKLTKVKAIVIHWVANTKSKAISNRNYFESLKNGKVSYVDKRGKKHYRYASAHYVIGLQGEIIQCVPNNEQAYHVGAHRYTQYALKNLSTHPNNCTIGIELTHINDEGKFTEKTLESCACLVAKLLKKYNLTTKNIIRHYDVTKKVCPRYFVNHPSEFEKFKNNVKKLIK